MRPDYLQFHMIKRDILSVSDGNIGYLKDNFQFLLPEDKEKFIKVINEVFDRELNNYYIFLNKHNLTNIDKMEELNEVVAIDKKRTLSKLEKVSTVATAVSLVAVPLFLLKDVYACISAAIVGSACLLTAVSAAYMEIDAEGEWNIHKKPIINHLYNVHKEKLDKAFKLRDAVGLSSSSNVTNTKNDDCPSL